MSLTLIAPNRRQCGVADYTNYLLPALRQRIDVRYLVEANEFTDAMNAVDLAHIQHQYFLFGGVAPWKNRFSAFANRLRIPAVMTVHEFVQPIGAPHVRAAIALTNRRNFRHPHLKRLIVHTEEDRRRMMASGIAPERIDVVRHGVPPMPVLSPYAEARDSLGLNGRFVVTLFGFLSRRKGHLFALESMRNLPSDTLLVFAGGRHPDDSTPYVQELETFVNSAGIDNQVRMTGYLDAEEVAAYLSATDLMIAPFSEVSGSGSLALAFACGKPILASDILPHREIVQDTPGALQLYAAGNANAFVEAIATLHADERALAAAAEGAYRYAGRHSYEQMAEETVTLYRDVLARRP